MGPSEKEVLEALRKVRDPELGADVVSMGMIKDLRVEGGRVYFTLELTTPACPFNEQLKEEVLRAVQVGQRCHRRLHGGAVEGSDH